MTWMTLKSLGVIFQALNLCSLNDLNSLNNLNGLNDLDSLISSKKLLMQKKKRVKARVIKLLRLQKICRSWADPFCA